jgi:hypothetical protein
VEVMQIKGEGYHVSTTCFVTKDIGMSEHHHMTTCYWCEW